MPQQKKQTLSFLQYLQNQPSGFVYSEKEKKDSVKTDS